MKGAGNMQTMQQYITEMGLEYSQKQFDACLTAFVSEMERGLAGGASSLKMIPAYLDAQAPPSDGGPVIAIDMGGTNLRIALIEWKNSRMHFLDRRQYPMPGTQGNLERSEFFEQIAEYLLPIADQSARIGLCFSFPCEILPTLEGKVLNFNKEVSIRNASGALLGQEIDAALQRSGCRVRHRTCVINDTVATLLGARAQAVRDYAGYIGFILGTGTNSCYREKNTRIPKSEFLRKKKGYSLVNLESGGFAGLALNRVRGFSRQPARQRECNKVGNGVGFSERKFHLLCDLHKSLRDFFGSVAGIRCRGFTLPALLPAVFREHPGIGKVVPACDTMVHSRGDEVWIVTRGKNVLPQSGRIHSIVCDVNDPDALLQVLHGKTFDAAIDFICFTSQQAKEHTEALRGKVAHFIFISSCTVYQKPCLSLPITEDTPLKNPFSSYARGKIACELYFQQEYREHGFPVTIVRPSHTYGETKLVVGPTMGWQVSHWTLVDRVLRGKPVVVHDTGRSRWTVTHSDDVAVGIVGLLGNRAAVGNSFHITGEVSYTWNEIMQTYGFLLGREVKIAAIPSQMLIRVNEELRAKLYGDMAENAIFCNRKIKQFVPEYAPSISLHEGLARSLNWYWAHPKHQIADEEYNRWLDALISEWSTYLYA